MRSKWMVVAGVILMFVCLSGAWAQDAGLKAKVELFYDQAPSIWELMKALKVNPDSISQALRIVTGAGCILKRMDPYT